ncbi:MAG: hypothetical protein F4X72_14940 [Dehalococcoidia bacterium]|nr:hypothetical protein [Dehalococcoidia bacterium]MYD52619.1 hypothetical protein [Dehalococcoidia bacterium]
MHSNIETTIDRFLAEVVERGIVTDLEPLRTRIVRVEPRPVTTEPATIERVDLTPEDSEEEADKIDDEVI